MKHYFFLSLAIFILGSCAVSNDIETTKGSNPVVKQTLIYALPQTSLSLTIEATKTITKKGIYAEFAQRLLSISNVPMRDSEKWNISDVIIKEEREPDASQYYTLSYKTYPYNLDKLLSFSENGIILDFANAWKSDRHLSLPQSVDNKALDPLLLEAPIKEKVDTFYKTIMTDTSFVKIPVLKKQQEAKSIEEAAKEIAKQILKIRKQKLKILRGEIENYQPDGDALKYSINELNKLEDIYLSFFIGVKKAEKKKYSLTITPQKENLTGEVCYFSPEKGLLNQGKDASKSGSSIAYQIIAENKVPAGMVPEKTKNTLYFRIPAMTNVIITLNGETIATKKIPVYQFGYVQGMVLNP